jgi:hypothetical protein
MICGIALTTSSVEARIRQKIGVTMLFLAISTIAEQNRYNTYVA